MGVETCQQRRHFRPGDMRGDAEREAPHDGRRESGDGAFMRRQEIACRVEEGGALRGQAHHPRRPLDELVAETVLEPLQLTLIAPCVVPSASAARVKLRRSAIGSGHLFFLASGFLADLFRAYDKHHAIVAITFVDGDPANHVAAGACSSST